MSKLLHLVWSDMINVFVPQHRMLYTAQRVVDLGMDVKTSISIFSHVVSNVISNVVDLHMIISVLVEVIVPSIVVPLFASRLSIIPT